MTLPIPAPRLERHPSALPPTARELARAALGDVRGADVLVAAEDVASLGLRTSARPEAWRSLELPTWSFDAVAAEGLLSRAADVEALLLRLRTWVRPDAPFAFVEPLAPAAWEVGTSPPEGALGARELELVRRVLPSLRVARLPVQAARPPSPWAGALRSAVESAALWLPGLWRDPRIAVLSGRLP